MSGADFFFSSSECEREARMKEHTRTHRLAKIYANATGRPRLAKKTIDKMLQKKKGIQSSMVILAVMELPASTLSFFFLHLDSRS